jgi:NDP-sugar pyrophosphorylase family protein
MKAMIFAAGFGTRLYPLTKTTPKALIKVQGKPLLDHCIYKLINLGIKEIVINVHHFAEQIIAYVNSNHYPITVHISHEKKNLFDTGGGLKYAASFFDKSPILLYNVDIISNINLVDLINYHKEKEAIATLVVRNRKTKRYLLFNELNKLIGWENIQTKEQILNFPDQNYTALAFNGIHIIETEIFKYMPNKNIFSMIELYLEVSKRRSIIAFEDSKSDWLDVGKIADLNYLNNQ